VSPGADAAPGADAVPGAVASIPKPKHYPVSGGMFIDPAEDREVPGRVKGRLYTGDMVTVMPGHTRGYNFLYFIVMNPNEQMRLSRIYPHEMLKNSAAPLKITVRDRQPGEFQVVLLATEDEIPTIQNVIQDANLMRLQGEDAREARIDRLIKGVGLALRPDSWSYKVLGPLPYTTHP
jgi:hypothetical protein